MRKIILKIMVKEMNDLGKQREISEETMALVEAVLERLEFHAFEEVLIWSEENASKALRRCLKNTLNEFKSGKLVLTSSYPKLKHYSIDNVVNGLQTALIQAQEHQDNLNEQINSLKAQLAEYSKAALDVLDERNRQIEKEKYSKEHDDSYQMNELTRAAASYVNNVVSRGWVFNSAYDPEAYQSEEVPDLWPWADEHWKPTNPRRDLVKAAALIIAEIDRRDRSRTKRYSEHQ